MKEVILYPDGLQTGMRLDNYLAQELDITRSAVKKLVDSGSVRMGANPVKAGHRLRVGEVITIELPEAAPLDVTAENIPIDIMYEDAHLIVVNKVRGMVVHPAPGHYSGTLVNALLYHCKESLSGINGVLRPGIVHRIDRDTSGVLVAAKNDAAHNHLAEQLSTHSMLRVYHGIARGNIKQDSGTIDAPLKRHQTDRKKIAVFEGGKRAVTHYKVLSRFSGYTYIEARLETGRTHQIRVHMAYIGHPLLGDLVYGAADKYGLQGQALHAKVLGFVHPHTGGYMEFDAGLPAYFESLLYGR